MPKWTVYKEERFRTPLATERTLGLWVDRIGAGFDHGKPRRLRLLGQYALVYVEKGSGAFFSPVTGEIPVRAGQAILLFPDEPNTYYAHGRWMTKWIVWNGHDATVLEQLGFLSRRQPIEADPLGIVNQAHARLSRIIHDEDLAAVLERKNIILDMVLGLFKSARESAPHRGRDDLMEKVITFLTDHYTVEMSIETVSKKFNLSYPHFRRLFKQYTGRSPREFVTALRISRAKELLSQGRSVKETAALVGYDDLFYFMRVFKKTVGISPGKFTFIAT
jgi:AraC family transcriptional regulator, arabinose operon regulatory protein